MWCTAEKLIKLTFQIHYKESLSHILNLSCNLTVEGSIKYWHPTTSKYSEKCLLP